MRKENPPVFNEEDARRFYRWLDHRPDEYTELRIISWPPGSAPVIQRWGQSERDFLKICREWSGKRQVYCGINPRFREGGANEDVARVISIPLDIDSFRHKDLAATEAELAAARERMVEINSWMRTQGYKAPFIAMSGNGYHLLPKVDITITEDLSTEVLSSKIESYFFNEVPGSEKTDKILDAARIIKIPGTLSIKGIPTEERPHRLSYILHEGDPGIDLLLGQHILELEPYEASIPFTAAAEVTAEKEEKRRTGGLRPCFKRFAEEGGLLSKKAGEDSSLRLALVIEGHKIGYSQNEIIDLFGNADNFDPKITANRVIRQLHKLSVKGLKGKQWSCLSIYKHGGCYFGEVCKYYAKRVKNRLAKKDSKNISKTPPKNSERLPDDAFFDEEGNFVPVWLGNTLLEDNRYAAMGEKSKVWIYNPENGVWEDNGIEKIQETATHLLGDHFKNAYVTEVVKYIRYVRYIPPSLLGSSTHKIVVKNGVLNLDTGELTPFDPELYEITSIPVSFDPTAKCPKIEKVLNEVLLPGWADTILELIGYTLLKSYPIARIFIFHGVGRNGKSQLIIIIRNFLGEKNVSSVTLQQIVKNTFAPAHLHGKLANLCADIPATPIKYTGIIKTLTGGGDTITAHHKYFALFDFVNHAKLIFSANEVPPAHDNTPAWLRRPILIDFPNVFPAGDPGTIMDLGNKISTDEELSGLLNLALAGLQRLLKQGRFTNEEALAQRAEKYIRESNPAQYFITQFVEEAPSMLDKLEKAVLYKNYVRLCHALGRRPLASNIFSAEIPRYLPYIDDGEFDKVVGKTKKGKTRTRKTRVWYGIRLKTEALTQAIANLKTKRNHRYDVLKPQKFGGLSPDEKEGKKERDRKNRIDNDENVVGKSPRDPTPRPKPLPVQDDRLFSDAIRIIQEAGGRMKQQNLFQALIDGGYTFVPANLALREDKRFIFMGMDVRLANPEEKRSGP